MRQNKQTDNFKKLVKDIITEIISECHYKMNETRVYNEPMLLNHVVNHLSSNSIANYTNVVDYKTIDKIRAEMIRILQKRGDEPYSISATKKLALQAYNALK